jgi:hypothetical protein
MSDVKIEHRIGVAAPPHVLWELLKDIESWPSWNPIYAKVHGRLGYGEVVQLNLTLPDQAPMDLEATIIEWVPDEQIHWTTRTLHGLLRTTRYIEIDKLTEEGCIFSNGELVQGFMGKSVARRLGRSMYRGFELMGEAVKEKAEAMWRDQKAPAS